jgi:hypothetical protein
MSYSKKELALSLGYFFDNARVDYRKLEKRVIKSGVLEKLNMSIDDFKKMHKERFDAKQTQVIKSHFGLN